LHILLQFSSLTVDLIELSLVFCIVVFLFLPEKNKMYQGGSKENGVIVGKVGGGGFSHMELGDAQDMVSAEESILGFDENGNEVAISACLDPSSGEVTWVPGYNLQFVKDKTVAMSQMTSMLRDTDRNNLFETAIQIAISSFIQRNQRRPVVLDIGCGTGLLSLFAARHGAELVFAVEMFDAMAAIAQNVVAANNLSDKIFVINAKSTEIERLPCEVDLIISELLDSSLLGESCLPSHADAIKRFLRKDESTLNAITNQISLGDRIIPNRGEVYATLIESNEVRSMARVDSIISGREPFLVHRNEYAMHCKGGWPMIPIHWEALEFRGAKKLSDSVPCLQISFSEIHQSIYMNMLTNPEMSPNGSHESLPNLMNNGINPHSLSAAPIKSYDTEIQVKADGTIHGILLWWKTFLLSPALNPSCDLSYSTEPGVQNWQDHWQQIIYPLQEPFSCKTGDIIKLHISHDDLTIWVNVTRPLAAGLSSASNNRATGGKRNREEHSVRTLQSMMPRFYDEKFDLKHNCICGWHLLHGMDQFLYYNYSFFNKMWDTVFDQLLDPLIHKIMNSKQSLIMDISDGSVLPITLGLKLKKKLMSLQLSPTSSCAIPLMENADAMEQQQYHQFLLKKIHLISKEKKQFSGMFYSQLIEANDLDELISVWDGNITELDPILESVDYLQTFEPNNHMDHFNFPHLHSNNTSNANFIAENSLLPLPPVIQNDQHPKISLLMSNCFSYQLHSLPLWDAISFYYQKISLQQLLDVNAVVLPCKALIMAMPLELYDLKKCHGLVHK
jgi:predicted RNA methylase